LKYSLVYTLRADRDIQRLERATKRRIDKSLQRYAEDPMRYAEELTDPRLGTYRFRIGDYRVIFDLEKNEIVVLKVGHRSEIYKR
jgi:mRNA interferase RelE/StbE